MRKRSRDSHLDILVNLDARGRPARLAVQKIRPLARKESISRTREIVSTRKLSPPRTYRLMVSQGLAVEPVARLMMEKAR